MSVFVVTSLKTMPKKFQLDEQAISLVEWLDQLFFLMQALQKAELPSQDQDIEQACLNEVCKAFLLQCGNEPEKAQRMLSNFQYGLVNQTCLVSEMLTSISCGRTEEYA